MNYSKLFLVVGMFAFLSDTVSPQVATPPVVAPQLAPPPALSSAVKTDTPKSGPVASPEKQQAVPVAAAPSSTEKSKDPKALAEGMLDTVDIEEGGNWLLVRKALEDTVDAIEDINKVFTAALDIRMNYLKKRNKADKDFNVFLSSIGFDLGDLDRVITQIIDRLEQERIEDTDLTEQERSFLASAREKKEELTLLRTDVKSVTDYDAQIDDVIMTVEEQINKCRDYQDQAWKNFQAIKRIYDDEKAERLYQKTEIILTNMQEIQKYLNGPLVTYFDELIQELHTVAAKMTASLNSLKTKGIDLKNAVAHDMAVEDFEDREAALAAAREQQRKLDASQSWFAKTQAIMRLGFWSIIDSVKHAISWVASFFMRSGTVTKNVAAVEGQHVATTTMHE